MERLVYLYAGRR